MDNETLKKILYITIAVMIFLILFIFVPSVWRGNEGQKISTDTNGIFKEQINDDSENNEKTETENNDIEEDENNDENGIEFEDDIEIEPISNNPKNPPIQRNLNDPFYAKIKQRIAEQKNISEIYIPTDYYPGDNYVKNAAGNDGKVRIFKKQPILVYVPRNEYYDAITQAFVTYNSYFKGLLSFNTVEDPGKAQIKIVMTDDFGNKSDIPDAIGLGRPLRFDRDGNIIYSEVSLLTKNRYNNQKMPLIVVYNTMLHELGHALGIAGHSQDPNDVMYKEITQQYHNDLMKFSDRDIETFKILYCGRKSVVDNALSGVKIEKLKENIKYAQESNDADSYLQVAASYYEVGEYTKAFEAYKKALELNPNNYRIYLGLSNCYLSANQYDYALTYAKHALNRAQTNEQKASCNEQIGLVYIRLEKPTDAYPYLNNALLLDNENPGYFINYLVICGALGKHDLAHEAYNNYIKNYDESAFGNKEEHIINWAKNKENKRP